MRTIKAVPISYENFAPFGQFYTMDAPKGHALCGEIHQLFSHFGEKARKNDHHPAGVSHHHMGNDHAAG